MQLLSNDHRGRKETDGVEEAFQEQGRTEKKRHSKDREGQKRRGILRTGKDREEQAFQGQKRTSISKAGKEEQAFSVQMMDNVLRQLIQRQISGT